MDLKPLYKTASRDLIILTAEVTRLQLTISHFRNAAVLSEVRVEPEVKTMQSKPDTQKHDTTLTKLLSKATGVFSESEIPARKRLVNPASLQPPKIVEQKIPGPKIEKENVVDFEKIKRAAAQARGKKFPGPQMDLQTPKLVKWAQRRIVTDEAPQIGDAVNAFIIDLATAVEKEIGNDQSKRMLETVSLLYWAINGKLLTFWKT